MCVLLRARQLATLFRSSTPDGTGLSTKPGSDETEYKDFRDTKCIAKCVTDACLQVVVGPLHMAHGT